MSIQVGRIAVENGSPTVNALWEMLAPSLAQQVPANGGVKFTPSGALARCTEHVLTGARLTVDRQSGTPAATDTIDAPVASSSEGATADSGSSNTLTDGSATFPNYSGYWLGIRVGSTNEEWHKIASNTSTIITIEGTFETNPSSGHTYVIHASQTSPHGGWLNRSPVEWQTLGVTSSDVIAIGGVWYDVGAVPSEDRITLSANYAGADADNLDYSVHRGFTTLGIPYINPGDNQTAAIFRRAMTMLDQWIGGLAEHVIDDTGEASYENSWGTPTTGLSLRWYQIGAFVLIVGQTDNGGSPSSPSTIFTLPSGSRPEALIYSPDGALQVTSAGLVQWLTGAPTTDLPVFFFFLGT